MGAGNADRCGFANGRETRILQQRREAAARLGEVALTVAEVRTERERNQTPGYSIHRVDITDPMRGPT